LYLLANPIDKDRKPSLTILSLLLAENVVKDDIHISPISKIDIHPSILDSPAELIDISYMFSPGILG
jgi:hypothetical protein